MRHTYLSTMLIWLLTLMLVEHVQPRLLCSLLTSSLETELPLIMRGVSNYFGLYP
uniref:Uncharacterized protein n=1 Tax=Arundo donax TaxID=35708 RepID=A0A0A8ZX05_ARUDO